MVTKEIFGTVTAIIILAGIAYALYRGDATVKVIGASGDALSKVVTAATPRD